MAIPMPIVQDIRRLDRQGMSRAQIARRLHVDRGTVAIVTRIWRIARPSRRRIAGTGRRSTRTRIWWTSGWRPIVCCPGSSGTRSGACTTVCWRRRTTTASIRPRCLCSISCCGFSHDDFSGLGRACRPRNGLNWMVLVSSPERTGKDYDQHVPSTVYPSFAAERGIRRVDRAENTCRRSRRCVSTSRRRICRPCRR